MICIIDLVDHMSCFFIDIHLDFIIIPVEKPNSDTVYLICSEIFYKALT